MDLIPVPPMCLISLCRSQNSSFISFPAYGTSTYMRWVRQLHGVLTQKSGVVTGHLCDRHFSDNDFQMLQSGIGDTEGILPRVSMAPTRDPLNAKRASSTVVVIKDEPPDNGYEQSSQPENNAFAAFKEALARVYPDKRPQVPAMATASNNDLTGEEKYKPPEEKSLNDIFKKLDNVKKMKTKQDEAENITVKVDPDSFPLSKKQKAVSEKKIVKQKKSLKAYRHTEVKQNSYQCHQCQRPFQQKVSLAKHIALFCEAGVKDFVCPMCGSSFPTKAEFARHMTSHSDEMSCIQCSQCKLVFPTQDDLDKHSKTHIKVVKDPKPVVQPKPKPDVEPKPKKPRAKYTLKKPKPVPYTSRIKNPQTVFPCRRCDATFDNRPDRRVHTRTHFIPFECHHCGETFERKVRLHTHLSSHFVSLRKYVCPVCGWGFTAPFKLNNHMVRHKNERNFVCEECSAAFNCSSDLRKHKRSHNTIDLYTCYHCNNMYKKRDSLIHHMVEHFPSMRRFMCSQCGKRFRSNFLLTAHVERHTEVRDFKCTECPRAFKSMRDLKVHMTRHYKNQKSYSCFVCNKSFTRAHGLKRHEAQIGHQKVVAQLLNYPDGIKPEQVG